MTWGTMAADTPAAAATGLLPVRVMVPDVWDELPFTVPPATTVAELKRRALADARVMHDPEDYCVKYRGAELFDEQRSLEAVGVLPGAPLILVRRRRIPVR
ncbi:MAG TPA: hypothetical protein VFS40_04810 [Gemmatimonadales bacterium]|nr:hypothetical protein [Gemmatimonadales bacterium]